MAKYNWTDITREDVIEAVSRFLRYNPEYPEPKSTFLLYEGKRLPAKHLRGMAYEIHYKTPISKSDFGGGAETVNFFERLGFTVEYSGKNKPIKNEKVLQSDNKSTRAEKDSHIKAKNTSEIVGPNNKTLWHQDGQATKITIPTKRVIEQKNALQLILNKLFDGDVVCEKTFEWLKTPAVLSGEYIPLYQALKAYRGDTTFAKKNVVLRCDFVCESKKLIIEYDERQHFSEARRIALESYLSVPLCYDRNKWIRACEDIRARDNSPQNRDEIRAYYDSTRDIECAKHGYRLIRIMHGEVDFESDGAIDRLKNLIWDKPLNNATSSPVPKHILKVCMYLQTDELKNKDAYDKSMAIVKKSDIDLIVFPEFCYIPGIDVIEDADIADSEDLDRIYAFCTSVSQELGRAIVISTIDSFGTIYSVYANAYAVREETQATLYIKHTQTEYSALEFENYPELVQNSLFRTIIYKDYKLGMTICYDCNHALFSRMYALKGGVDLIVNCTGGDVVFDKWYKYNKARAIENSCCTLVTMGGVGTVSNPKNFVYGFNPNGGELLNTNLISASSALNVPGGLYVYEINKDPGAPKKDSSNEIETANKNWQFEIKCGNTDLVLDKSDALSENLFRLEHGNENIIFCIVHGMDIMQPEKVLSLLYSPKLKGITNKRYIIINKHNHIDTDFFETKLSLILKVRAMENFCAVILESSNINKCYQSGKNRTAQVVKAQSGIYLLDLERTTGAEAIWKNKQGMKASWRKNYEWLIQHAVNGASNSI